MADCIVYCNPTYGPTFGSGHDLYIADKCDKNNNSFANLGSSYNVERDEKYPKDQKTFKAFSGATANKNFGVE